MMGIFLLHFTFFSTFLDHLELPYDIITMAKSMYSEKNSVLAREFSLHS